MIAQLYGLIITSLTLSFKDSAWISVPLYEITPELFHEDIACNWDMDPG